MKNRAIYLNADTIVRMYHFIENSVKLSEAELEKWTLAKYQKSVKKNKNLIDFLPNATKCLYISWFNLKYNSFFRNALSEKDFDYIHKLMSTFESRFNKLANKYNIPIIEPTDEMMHTERKDHRFKVYVNEWTLCCFNLGFDINFAIQSVDHYLRNIDEPKYEEYLHNLAPFIINSYDDFVTLDNAWNKITTLDNCPHLDYFEKVTSWMSKNGSKLLKYINKPNENKETEMAKIKSFKIKKDLFVNEVAVDMPDQTSIVRKPSNQFIIIDRSGSMWRQLDNVCDTIIKYVESLADGSTVSVGYFASKGEYGLSVPYTLKKEAGAVKKIVDSYRRDLGCTCFSEILAKVNEQMDGKLSSLYFFTDGCNNDCAWRDVVSELEKMKDNLEVALFVGCGYINRNNMTEMADITNGSFIHLNKFDEFEQSLYGFGEGITESVPGKIVNVTPEMENICSVLGKQVIGYTVSDGKIAYKATNKKQQKFYCTSKVALGDEAEVGKNEVPFRAIAYYLTQHNKANLAMEVINYLGDKAIIDRLANCFTNDEYAKVENFMRGSIFYTKKRYEEGKDTNYLPADDAFCVLDALDVITSEKDALIHLNDKEFDYHAISRGAEQIDGAKLIQPEEITANANTLVYNDTALNVSVQCTYTAEVPLNTKEFSNGKDAKKDMKFFDVKEGTKVPVTCFRNYSIIADAKLNTDKIVVSKLSRTAASKLKDIATKRKDGKFVIDFSSLPLINKTYLGETSAKKLAENSWKAKELGTELSVLRYLMKEVKAEKAKEKTSDNYAEMLEKYFYIKNGSYNPPKKSVESTDSYMRYEFKISFKGYSDASVSSVVKKLDAGKDLTDRELPVGIAYAKFNGKKFNELKAAYDERIVEYRELNNKIQHAKFAIILINRGSMPEFDSRENMSIDIDVKIGKNKEKVTTVFEVVQKPVKI